jgi:hypothetical protein
LPGHKVLILRKLLLPGGFIFANLTFHSVPQCPFDSRYRLEVTGAKAHGGPSDLAGLPGKLSLAEISIIVIQIII